MTKSAPTALACPGKGHTALRHCKYEEKMELKILQQSIHLSLLLGIITDKNLTEALQ